MHFKAASLNLKKLFFLPSARGIESWCNPISKEEAALFVGGCISLTLQLACGALH